MADKNTNKKPRRWRLGIVLLVLGVAIACGEGLGGFLISSADEVDIGRGVDDQIEQEYRIVQDSDPVAQWARALVVPLERASADFRDPADIGGFKVEVIADDELINAFAAPGGYTYLSTGLILNATTCAEIAGVMGHELAHVTERHGVKNIEDAYAVELATTWLLGEGLAAEGAKTIHGFLMATTYSQEHENEADEYGLQIAYNAGYNPYGLVDFFEKLLALSEGSVQVPQFLSSHPATQDRIQAVDNMIQSLYGGAVIRNQTQTDECIETQIQLAEVQTLIRSGSLATR